MIRDSGHCDLRASAESLDSLDLMVDLSARFAVVRVGVNVGVADMVMVVVVDVVVVDLCIAYCR